MTKSKRIGIWMDHSSAHTMEFTTSPIETMIIHSDPIHEGTSHHINRSENVAHNKEQHRQAAYYKRLGEIILNYDEVILFGPTEAKVELFNVLRSNPVFVKVNIEVKQADKMTENQQHAFVRNYFTNH